MSLFYQFVLPGPCSQPAHSEHHHVEKERGREEVVFGSFLNKKKKPEPVVGAMPVAKGRKEQKARKWVKGVGYKTVVIGGGGEGGNGVGTLGCVEGFGANATDSSSTMANDDVEEVCLCVCVCVCVLYSALCSLL